MGKGHHHHHHHNRDSQSNILLAFFLNFGFAIVELVGGILTNSMAIYSDALHDLGDSIALFFAYISERISGRQADAKFTYGYRRFSVLSAFINGLILLGGSIFIIYEAVHRILDPQEVKPEGMLALAVLGVLVNGFAAYRLSKQDTMNQRMVMLHLLEDILGWVGVIIVSFVLLFKPWYILDSILSILISLIILRGVYRHMRKIGAIFLQRFPDDLEIERIKNEILDFDLVNDVHAIQGWSIDEDSVSLSFHVTVPGETRVSEVEILKKSIKDVLKRHGVRFSSIEFESSEEYCC